MIWLSTSLFCNKIEWNKLFSGGIIPFLADRKTIDLLNAYTIEFNYLSGENIRLSLLVTEKNAPQLAQYINEYFKSFFLNIKLFAPEIKLPVNGIFMPFPANTIRYGLYPPKTITNKEKEDYMFSIRLSQIILEALKEDKVDDERILTFAFYLQIGLIKMINLIYPGFVPDYIDNKSIDASIIKKQFEESGKMLAEITDDIMITINEAGISVWFKKWLNSCKAEIERHKNMECESLYRKMIFVIHKHLATTPPMNSMLSYFIEQTLLNKRNI